VQTVVVQAHAGHTPAGPVPAVAVYIEVGEKLLPRRQGSAKSHRGSPVSKVGTDEGTGAGHAPVREGTEEFDGFRRRKRNRVTL
jgi:hypothetical protein